MRSGEETLGEEDVEQKKEKCGMEREKTEGKKL